MLLGQDGAIVPKLFLDSHALSRSATVGYSVQRRNLYTIFHGMRNRFRQIQVIWLSNNR